MSTKNKQREPIDFDLELIRGTAAYSQKLGQWWLRQSSNASHANAYRRIASYLRDSFRDSPQTIVDYACGAGNLLAQLGRLFPESRLLGIDGSELLLSKARLRLARRGRLPDRIRLRVALLPDFGLPKRFADWVVYSFPNLVFAHVTGPQPAHLSLEELAAARRLAWSSDGASDDPPEQMYQELIRNRLVSLNIRGLLKRGGIFVRVDYAGLPRDQFTKLELQRIAFEEASLDSDVAGLHCHRWFRLAACCYVRSAVMEDVFDQTGDKRHKRGGYSINVLQAIGSAPKV